MADRGVQDLATVLEQLGDLMAAAPDAAEQPTPCADWSVHDLAQHVAGTTARFADAASGREVDWTSPPSPVEDPAATFAAAAQRLREAYASGGDDAALGQPLAELSVHTWDLATALGRDTGALDPRPAERGLAFLRDNLRPEARGSFFGPERSAPADADAYARIAAFAGRDV